MDQNMEFCSLEDEECSQLFITQESKDNSNYEKNENCEKMEVNDSVYLGNSSTDFSSPCVSLVSRDSIYSDISDDDDFELPSSQLAIR